MKRMEFRIKDVQLDHSEDRKIGGYVNVTERESETLYSQQRGKWFKEVMKKGVFERALAKNQSIPCLLEHNWDRELAHTSFDDRYSTIYECVSESLAGRLVVCAWCKRDKKTGMPLGGNPLIRYSLDGKLYRKKEKILEIIKRI